ERRAALPAAVLKRVAVAALLHLEHKRSLPLERRASVQESERNRRATPRIHHRTPRRMAGQMRECTQCYSHQQDGQNRDGTPLPTLLAFSRGKRETQQDNQSD